MCTFTRLEITLNYAHIWFYVYKYRPKFFPFLYEIFCNKNLIFIITEFIHRYVSNEKLYVSENLTRIIRY